jgi:hypothetical protein
LALITFSLPSRLPTGTLSLPIAPESRRFQGRRILPRSQEKEVGMTMFANLRRDLVLLPVVLAALVADAEGRS